VTRAPLVESDLIEIWLYIYYRRVRGGIELIRVLSSYRDIASLLVVE
jgi:hypothetical protein